jgi:Na+:H+ antiporter, NhaA family
MTLLLLLNRARVTMLTPYLLCGVVLWVAILQSGIHATIAGVLLAAFVPLRTTPEHSPLLRLEHAIAPWVTYGVLPVFALANAGVPISGLQWQDLTHPVLLGVMLGLFIGKPIGILLACWLAVRSGLASLPAGLTWRQVLGAGALCGIGFTMSLFIASLAFGSEIHTQNGLDRAGILLGSLLSGCLGFALLRHASPRAL